MRRLFACAALLLVAGFSPAADEVKLADFKVKAKSDTATDLAGLPAALAVAERQGAVLLAARIMAG